MEDNMKKEENSEEKETVSKNFIEQIIEKDLQDGTYDHVMTRFPRSQTDTFI